jgi:hypothetical protein
MTLKASRVFSLPLTLPFSLSLSLPLPPSSFSLPLVSLSAGPALEDPQAPQVIVQWRSPSFATLASPYIGNNKMTSPNTLG